METSYQTSIQSYAKYFDLEWYKEQKNEEFRLGVFSANLQNFLPETPVKLFENIYGGYMKNVFLGSYDQGRLDVIENTHVHDQYGILDAKQPYIFCSIHMGSYQIISNLIARNRINQALLVGNEYMETHAQQQYDNFNKLAVRYNLENVAFDIIDAEDKASGIRMLRKLNSGHSLFAYIDGNTGLGGRDTINEEKMAKVSFLGKQIYARKGLAYISHASKTPIVPVYTFRDTNLQNHIVILKPIFPNFEQSREEFSKSTTELIYRQFEKPIAQHPEQWEGWNHLHYYLVSNEYHPPKREINQLNKVFNKEDFSLCKVDKLSMILNRRTYEVNEISNSLYRLLKKNIDFVISKEKIGIENYEKLVELDILI